MLDCPKGSHPVLYGIENAVLEASVLVKGKKLKVALGLNMMLLALLKQVQDSRISVIRLSFAGKIPSIVLIIQ